MATYKGPSMVATLTRDYLVANQEAKVADVASRYSDGIELPKFAAVEIKDPRRSIKHWPSLLIMASQSVANIGNAQNLRGYRFEFAILAQSKDEEKAKLNAMRYMEALMELLREMTAAKLGVRWLFVPLPDELYFPTYTTARGLEHISDARLIIVCSSPMGDDWSC